MKLGAATLILALLCTATVVLAQNSNPQLNDQLWEAARAGDAKLVASLLDKGADVNARFRYGTTALFKAAERGHAEVVKLLLARGADATVKDTFYGATAMVWALDQGHFEVVRALLEKDAASAANVLMTGAREGKAELVQMVLERGDTKPEQLTAALAAVLEDKSKTAIADMLKKAGAVPPPVIDAAVLQSYVGKYKGDPGPEIAISYSEGKLIALLTGRGPIGLMPVDKTTFKPTAFDGIILNFNLEGDKVTGFTLKQGPTTTLLKKIE